MEGRLLKTTLTLPFSRAYGKLYAELALESINMACDYFQVLNLAKEGKWHQAHQLVQPHSDELSCLLHAYLHRVEGDTDNASYWYRRAGSTMPDNDLQAEFLRLSSLAETARNHE